MADKGPTKREQVAEMIKAGESTKAQIGEALEMSVGSVSSQMTYLRWQGKFITFDDDKVLSFTDEEGFKVWDTARKSNRKSPAASKLSPEEQSVKVAKTLANQGKTLASWEKKLEGAEEILDDKDTEENQDYVDECEANIVLLTIKIKRNAAKASDLPEPEVVEEEVVMDSDEKLL